MAILRNKPTIGVTIDHEINGGYSKYPWYALRENYSHAITKAGGVPILIPHELNMVDEYVSRIDGLIVTGGAFDVNPELYEDIASHETVVLKEKRTEFELRIINETLDRDLPTLGICGGEQLLNVALGGTLIQHIPDEVENHLEHEQLNPRNEPGHWITITKGTLIHDIVGVNQMYVNSAHHQAVQNVPKTARINAIASDGVIEGIEAPNFKFCIGVQWHPEFEVDPNDINIFKALVGASRR